MRDRIALWVRKFRAWLTRLITRLEHPGMRRQGEEARDYLKKRFARPELETEVSVESSEKGCWVTLHKPYLVPWEDDNEN